MILQHVLKFKSTLFVSIQSKHKTFSNLKKNEVLIKSIALHYKVSAKTVLSPVCEKYTVCVCMLIIPVISILCK